MTTEPLISTTGGLLGILVAFVTLLGYLLKFSNQISSFESRLSQHETRLASGDKAIERLPLVENRVNALEAAHAEHKGKLDEIIRLLDSMKDMMSNRLTRLETLFEHREKQ